MHEVDEGTSIMNKKNNGKNMNDKNVCSCSHHSIIPILTILFAIAFLLDYQGFLAAGSVNVIWPILVGIGGIVKLQEDKCSCC